ncbi:MAG: hypothetical protein KBF37_02300 [Saprospiraceae bacterium]|nr:hypothetical protein [Saprospiraceae bacterium]
MSAMRPGVLRALLFLSLFLQAATSPAQNSREPYGKNKVQYMDDQFNWWQYETSHFVLYYYGKSRESAKFIAEIAESENKAIQKLFEFHLRDKIELVLYADPSDHAQTNINLDGIWPEKKWKTLPRLKGQKILLFFDGNHSLLRNMLRSGLIQLYFASFFDGTALQDAVQQVVDFQLEAWFEEGLLRYLTYGWDQEAERAFLQQWKGQSFSKFSAQCPSLAGVSFWNFVVHHYGEQSISNWLYITRIHKDVEDAAQIVFSQSFAALETEWQTWYSNLPGSNSPPYRGKRIKLKPDEIVSDVSPSLYDGRLFLLGTNQYGRRRVRTLDPETGKLHTLFATGSKSKLYPPDNSYPIVIPHQESDVFSIVYEKRNRVYLRTQDPVKKSRIHLLPEDIQRVFTAAHLGKDLFALSANTNGFSDILLYSTKTRQYTKITDDRWDDLDIGLIPSDTGLTLAFRSNRFPLNPTAKPGSQDALAPFGLFAISLLRAANDKPTPKPLVVIDGGSVIQWQLANRELLLQTQFAHSKQWMLYHDGQLLDFPMDGTPDLIFSTRNGAELFPVHRHSNKTFLLSHKLTDVSFKPSAPSLPSDSVTVDSIAYPPLSQALSDSDSLYFQAPFGNPPNLSTLYAEFQQKKKRNLRQPSSPHPALLQTSLPFNQPFNSNLAIAYRDRFLIEDFSTSLNNELLSSQLQSYTTNAADFNVPELGILFKARIAEVLENYLLESGLRIPTTFNGMEAYLSFEHRLRRIDHRYTLHYGRQKDPVSGVPIEDLQQENSTWLFSHTASYPFSHYTALKAITTVRNDRLRYLSTSPGTLFDSTDFSQQRIGTRVEFVFDNALDLSLNIRTGWQFKLFFEVSKRFEISPGHKARLFPGALLLAGADARYHLTLLEKSSFSHRAFAYASFGRERILYHTGGTENWLFPRYASTMPLRTTGEYVYSALATEVRGHDYGARRGSSAFGYSAEIRVPVFQYFHPWKNNLLRNFQVIAFCDAAVVWDGFLPKIEASGTTDFSSKNPVVEVSLSYRKDPWIAGTGFGFRTSLFGYFLRVDHAWKIEDSSLRQPRWLFSLGLDF